MQYRRGKKKQTTVVFASFCRSGEKRTLGVALTPFYKKKDKKVAGFTLMEIIIATAIFIPMILLIVSSFMQLSSIHRGLNNKDAIMNQLNYSLHVIGEEFKFGSAFPDDCKNGCHSVLFMSTLRPDMPRVEIEYKFSTITHQLERAQMQPWGLCNIIPFESQCFMPMTSSEADIKNVTFYVRKPKSLRPFINVVMEGTIGDKGDTEPFHLSSTFSSRAYGDPNAKPLADNRSPKVTIDSPTTGPVWNANDAEYITLRGSATDNDSVESMQWHNDASGQTGYVLPDPPGGSFPRWETWLRIKLIHGVTNKITVTAFDQAGNTGYDILNVVTDTTLTEPYCLGSSCPWPSTYCSAYDNGKHGNTNKSPIVKLQWVYQPGSNMDIFRCDEGLNCPSEYNPTDYHLFTTWYDDGTHGNLQAGDSVYYYDDDDGNFRNGSLPYYAMQAWNGSGRSKITTPGWIIVNNVWCPTYNPDPGPPPPPECSDSIDNDHEGDGVDYPYDPDCTSPSDNDPTHHPPKQCSDGIDNGDPEDAIADYGFDPGCSSPNDDDETDPPPEPDPVTVNLNSNVSLLQIGVTGSPTKIDRSSPPIEVDWDFQGNPRYMTFIGSNGPSGSDFHFTPSGTDQDSGSTYFVIDIPDSTTPGQYDLHINVDGNNVFADDVDITLNVFKKSQGQQ